MMADTWASTVLTGLSIAPNPTNVAALHMWAASEGNSRGRGYNWINSVLPEPGSSTLPGNTAGVQNYTSYQQGIAATVATLRGSYWSGVTRALGTPGGATPNPTPSKKKTPINRAALARMFTAIHQANAPWTTTQPNYPAVMWTFLYGKGGTAGGVWASSTVTTTKNPTAPDPLKGCVWAIPNPFPFTSGKWCVLTRGQAKALKGALAIVAGTGIGLTGLLVLAASGLGSKAASRGLSAVGGALPGPAGTAVRAVSTGATRSAAQRTSARASLISAQTREATARARARTRSEATGVLAQSRESVRRQRAYDRATSDVRGEPSETF